MLKMIRRERKLTALKMADEALAAVNDDWEIIDPSDDEDTYSFNESIGENDENDVVIEDLESKDLDSFGSPSPETVPTVVSVSVQYGSAEYPEDDEHVEEDDVEEEDDDDDLDDELVPYCVNDRFGRQRMRKFGKKAHAKINYSKKPAYYSQRPGCVQGKHGLGLKHRLF